MDCEVLIRTSASLSGIVLIVPEWIVKSSYASWDAAKAGVLIVPEWIVKMIECILI